MKLPACRGKVRDFSGFHWLPCARRAKAGSEWCFQHDPVRQAAKDAAAQAVWDAREGKSEAAQMRATSYVKLLGGGTPHYHDARRLKDSGYTGGIVLTEDEVLKLLRRLGHTASDLK